jgi:L-fuconolactonase
VTGPVVDAHQHFWDTARGGYPWMTDELASIRRPFMPEDLASLLRQHGVDHTVLVQARMSLNETRELLDIGARTPFVAGVVGWVDLTGPDVGRSLADIKATAEGGKLVGIRHQVHDEVDAAWLLRSDVLRGLRAVGDAGLTYDLLVRTRELPAALEAVRLLPNVRFVVDHLAKPPIGSGQTAAWAEALAPLSEHSNVYCKLSGMVTEGDWSAWQPEDLAPYVRSVVDWFGEDRLMFGSDWPVCLLAASYGAVLDALAYTLRDLPESTRCKIMGHNAIRFYGL